jgi:NAD(P)H-dependent FMN reductase
MAAILGFSGSLRRGSYNTALLRAAAEIIPIEIISIREIPLYDADSEAEHGTPPVVLELRERFAAAGGLLIASPEYNGGMSGVAKNAIDWLSRPFRDIPRVFGGLPVALMGATNGRGGTVLSQASWLPVLRALGTHPWFGRQLNVSGAASLFDENGLRDDETRKKLERFATEFADFVATHKRR